MKANKRRNAAARILHPVSKSWKRSWPSCEPNLRSWRMRGEERLNWYESDPLLGPLLTQDSIDILNQHRRRSPTNWRNHDPQASRSRPNT